MITVDLEKVNDAIIQQRKQAEDDYDDELEQAQFDPEEDAEREGFVTEVLDKAQNHQKGQKVTGEKNIFSLFSDGFALFDNL